jgi:hypothetical protein
LMRPPCPPRVSQKPKWAAGGGSSSSFRWAKGAPRGRGSPGRVSRRSAPLIAEARPPRIPHRGKYRGGPHPQPFPGGEGSPGCRLLRHPPPVGGNAAPELPGGACLGAQRLPAPRARPVGEMREGEAQGVRPRLGGRAVIFGGAAYADDQPQRLRDPADRRTRPSA